QDGLGELRPRLHPLQHEEGEQDAPRGRLPVDLEAREAPVVALRGSRAPRAADFLGEVHLGRVLEHRARRLKRRGGGQGDALTSRAVVLERPDNALTSRAVVLERPDNTLTSRAVVLERPDDALTSRAVVLERPDDALTSRAVVLER